MRKCQLLVGVVISIFVGVDSVRAQCPTTNEATLVVAPEQRATFLPGEAITITVELKNSSSDAIVEPLLSEWEVSVVDSDGVALRDLAPPGQPRLWVPPPLGGAVDFSTIPSGGSKTVDIPLQNRFRISQNGTYVVQFALELYEVGDTPNVLSPCIRVESDPFDFLVDETAVIWQEVREPLTFHIVEVDNELSLRFYRKWRSPVDGEGARFSDYQILGPVGGLSPSPLVREQNGRVGVMYLGPEGDVCAVVEIEGHEVSHTPPVPAGASQCPPE